MNKFFTKVLLIIFIIFTNANGEIINDVKVTGNKEFQKKQFLF